MTRTHEITNQQIFETLATELFDGIRYVGNHELTYHYRDAKEAAERFQVTGEDRRKNGSRDKNIYREMIRYTRLVQRCVGIIHRYRYDETRSAFCRGLWNIVTRQAGPFIARMEESEFPRRRPCTFERWLDELNLLLGREPWTEADVRWTT